FFRGRRAPENRDRLARVGLVLATLRPSPHQSSAKKCRTLPRCRFEAIEHCQWLLPPSQVPRGLERRAFEREKYREVREWPGRSRRPRADLRAAKRKHARRSGRCIE